MSLNKYRGDAEVVRAAAKKNVSSLMFADPKLLRSNPALVRDAFGIHAAIGGLRKAQTPSKKKAPKGSYPEERILLMCTPELQDDLRVCKLYSSI